MRRACRRRVIQGSVALLLGYALLVLLLGSPVLVSRALPGGAGASAKPAGDGEPVLPLKHHPHRDTLVAEVEPRRGHRLAGIVSSLDLRHLNASRSGSLLKAAAEAAAAGARALSDLQTLETAA
jgi:hydroxyproline O-galactosyltransferase 2/3/4/5/6